MQESETTICLQETESSEQNTSTESKVQERPPLQRISKGTGAPDLNKSEEFQGVQFYKDTTAENLWYYSPVKQPWSHSRSKIANRIIWNARLSLTPTTETLAGFSQSHSNCKLVAIPVNLDNSCINISLPIGAPHGASVKILSGIPFPLIIFSATLDIKDSEFEKIDEAIKNSLEQGGLLTGELQWSFKASTVTMEGQLVIDMRQIANALHGEPSTEWILEKDFFRRLVDEIHASLPSALTTDVGSLAPGDTEIIESTIFSLCYPGMIADTKTQYVFDMKRKYTLYKLKDSADFPSEPLLQKIRSTQTVNQTLSLTL